MNQKTKQSPFCGKKILATAKNFSMLFVIALLSMTIFSACTSGMEKDAKKMGKLIYEYETDKMPEGDIEKATEFSDQCDEKYKNEETEFTFLCIEAVMDLSIQDKNWEVAVNMLDEYISYLDDEFENMPLSKVNDIIKKAEKYISKLYSKKGDYSIDLLDDLRDLEDGLAEIKDELKD